MGNEVKLLQDALEANGFPSNAELQCPISCLHEHPIHINQSD